MPALYKTDLKGALSALYILVLESKWGFTPHISACSGVRSEGTTEGEKGGEGGA